MVVAPIALGFFYAGQLRPMQAPLEVEPLLG